MKAIELKAGRTFGVTFQHGEEFMPSLADFCHENEMDRPGEFEGRYVCELFVSLPVPSAG